MKELIPVEVNKTFMNLTINEPTEQSQFPKPSSAKNKTKPDFLEMAEPQKLGKMNSDQPTKV